MEDNDHDRKIREVLDAFRGDRLHYFQLLLRLLPKPRAAPGNEDLVHLALFTLIREMIEDGLIECTWKKVVAVRVPDELWVGKRGQVWLQARAPTAPARTSAGDAGSAGPPAPR